MLRKYDPKEWGGTETHVVEITKRLIDLGWEVEVHAPHGPTTPDTALHPSVKLVRYRAFLPVIGSQERRKALIANAGNIASLDEMLRIAMHRSMTIVHLHTGGRIGGAVRTGLRVRPRPYVVSVHGPFMANREWLAEDTARRLSRVWDVGQPIGALVGARRVVDDANRIITFNEAEREAISTRVGDRVVRMDHGVDEVRLSSGSVERGCARFPELANRPVVTVVGRLASQKNQVLAVKAFAEGAPKDHVLALAGAATDLGYREKIEAAVRDAGVDDRVFILGNLDGNTDIPDLYAMSKVLMVTSTHEAFGLIVLEGWAAGCPVLFPNHSGMSDIASALGFADATLDTMEVTPWADRLRKTLADEHLREQNLTAGIKVVRERYSWDRVTKDLDALYQVVLEEHRRTV